MMKLINSTSIFILITLSFFTIAKVLLNFQLVDFGYYYQSIQYILQGISPYNNSQFVLNYPPSALLFFWIFGLIPFEISQRIWTIVSFLSLGLAVVVLIKSLDKKISISKILLIFGLAALSFPVKFTLGMGQINLFILTLLSLNFFFYKRSNLIKSGIVLGAAVGIKITPIFLVLFFLRKKEYKIIFIALLTYLLLSILAIILFGFDLTTDYYFRVFWNIPTVGNEIYYNQALTGFLARLDIWPNVARFINYLIFGILLVSSYIFTKISKPSAEQDMMGYGMFTLSILIGAGLAWQHHFVLVLISLIGLVFSITKKDSRLLLFLLVSSYILISINIKNPESYKGIFRLLLSHVLLGTIILFLLLVKKIKSFKLKNSKKLV